MQQTSNTSRAAFIHEAASNAYIATRAITGDEIIEQAKDILGKRFVVTEVFTQCEAVKDFFITQLSGLSYEVFSVAFLTVGNHLIAFEQMFRGTINEAHVYPREVVKRALELNAVRLILAHNHPSGANVTPSTQDRNLTKRLIKSFNLFDIEVLDHIIVSGNQAASFTELGMLDTAD